MDKLTIRSLIMNSLNKFSDNTALAIVGGEEISYASLGKRIQQVSVFLDLMGIKKGDSAAILGENMPNWGTTYLAVVCMGAVAVPILPDFHEAEIESILMHSESKIIFASQKQINRLPGLFRKKLLPLVVLDDFSDPVTGKILIDDIIPSEGTDWAKDPIDEETLAALIYTSGTTGSSKGVMLTHGNLAWMTRQSLTIQDVNHKDRFLSILPLSHTYENTLGLLLPLSTGASIYYLQGFPTPAVLVQAMSLVKPTTMLTVPLIIEKIYRRQILPKLKSNMITRTMLRFRPSRILLSRMAGKKLMKTFGGHLRFFGIGGAKLDSNTEKFLQEARFPYAIGYGLTETSPLLAGSPPHHNPLHSTGKAVQGVDIRISDPNPMTGEGEIQVKGRNIMKGYFKAPELTEKVFTEDGWFKTGDLGYMDPDGTLYIRGRIKNVILGANGENIYPEEIEEILNGIDYVEESLVVQEQGRIVALISINLKDFENRIVKLNERVIKVAHDSVDELLAEAQKFVNQRVNRFSRIHLVRLQPVPFEKTPTNKIKRYLYGG